MPRPRRSPLRHGVASSDAGGGECGLRARHRFVGAVSRRPSQPGGLRDDGAERLAGERGAPTLSQYGGVWRANGRAVRTGAQCPIIVDFGRGQVRRCDLEGRSQARSCATGSLRHPCFDLGLIACIWHVLAQVGPSLRSLSLPPIEFAPTASEEAFNLPALQRLSYTGPSEPLAWLSAKAPALRDIYVRQSNLPALPEATLRRLTHLHFITFGSDDPRLGADIARCSSVTVARLWALGGPNTAIVLRSVPSSVVELDLGDVMTHVDVIDVVHHALADYGWLPRLRRLIYNEHSSTDNDGKADRRLAMALACGARGVELADEA